MELVLQVSIVYLCNCDQLFFNLVGRLGELVIGRESCIVMGLEAHTF